MVARSFRNIMILILRDYNSLVSEKLKNSLQRLGKEVITLRQCDIANDVSVTFNMNKKEEYFKLLFHSEKISSEEIEGVLVEFDGFVPEHWMYMSERDAKYAATETTALWYSMLSSLKCPVINPPGSNQLSGAMPTISELYCKAQAYDIDVPGYSIIETGMVASQLLNEGVLASFVDMGENPYFEMELSEVLLKRYPTYFNQVRVRELPGNMFVGISAVGNQIFCTSIDGNRHGKKMKCSEIPEKILESLLKIHSSLNLIVAEYYFAIDTEGTWYLNSMTKNLSFDSLRVHDSDIIIALVNCII